MIDEASERLCGKLAWLRLESDSTEYLSFSLGRLLKLSQTTFHQPLIRIREPIYNFELPSVARFIVSKLYMRLRIRMSGDFCGPAYHAIFPLSAIFVHPGEWNLCSITLCKEID